MKTFDVALINGPTDHKINRVVLLYDAEAEIAAAVQREREANITEIGDLRAFCVGMLIHSGDAVKSGEFILLRFDEALARIKARGGKEPTVFTGLDFRPNPKPGKIEHLPQIMSVPEFSQRVAAKINELIDAVNEMRAHT